MKYFVIILLIVTFAKNITAQKTSPIVNKPPLDTSCFNSWPSVEKLSLSNDGNYVSYLIDNQPIGSKTLILQSLKSSWKAAFPGAKKNSFTDNSQKTIFINSGDSLCLLNLTGHGMTYIGNVKSYKLFMQNGNEWMAYMVKGSTKELNLRNIETGKEISLSGVLEYLISLSGDVLILKTELTNDTTGHQYLTWVDLIKGGRKVVWNGVGVDNLVLDDSATQLAFRVKNTNMKKDENVFWHYDRNMDNSEEFLSNYSSGIKDGMQLNDITRFSNDGSRLFFTLKETQRPILSTVKLDIWNYRDARLQPEQLLRARDLSTFDAVLKLKDHSIICLQQEGEIRPMLFNPVPDEYMFFDDAAGGLEDIHWSASAQPSLSIVSSRNGERKNIGLYNCNISPNGIYLVGYEPNKKELCSYGLTDGQIRNISNIMPVNPSIDEETLNITKDIQFAIWLPETPTSVLVYDKYDIWNVDPSGENPPVNLTNGYGRKNNIQFHLVDNEIVGLKDMVLARAFNLATKSEGFYAFSLNKPSDPKLLTMGPYDYTAAWAEKTVTKARDANVYVVTRSRADESPNYYCSDDCEKFRAISSLHPENNYNWLTSQLDSFNTLSGEPSEGVLYKPLNFDTTQKYPVIIQYYEQKSDNLNKYRTLYDDDAISIPWFVSHGYVVFTPDIHYKLGKNGQCAYETIMGAADYLQHFAWIDQKHMGVEGHSFGGFETNYLITQTGRFAAAISSSGISDEVADYGSLWGTGESKEGYMESRQGRMLETLWENPEEYLQNSPILQANKITTPLLLLANKGDLNVSFAQGLEMFLALRRMGKRVWMLQYDGQSHGVFGNAFIDFTMRSQQFFDFYLKSIVAPKWMIDGIPARVKGIENGMELEPNGVMPGPGLVEKSR